jgi:hypothetical protein
MKRLIVLATGILLAGPAFAEGIQDHIDSAEIFGGLGIGNYTKDLGSFTSSGLSWNIRAGVDAYRYFGAELDYQGISGGVNTLPAPGGGLLSGTNLTQAEVTVNAKAGYPILVGDKILRPYVLAGLGYAHLSFDQSLNQVGLQSDGALAIPLGFGATYKLTDLFAVDGRFTYNVLTGTKTQLAPSGDSWTLGVNIGAKFGG